MAERTTAMMDLISGIVSLCFFFAATGGPRHRREIWRGVFLFMSIASVLGAVNHGLEVSAALSEMIWIVTFAAMCLTCFLVAVGAWYEAMGERHFLNVLVAACTGACFLALLMWLLSGYIYRILPLTIAGSLLGIVCTVLFGRAAARGKRGSRLLLAATLLAMVAAVIQAVPSVSLMLIWEFDHNGLSHILTLAALVLFYIGYRKGAQIQE